MSKINSTIEVKDAFFVTRDEVTQVSAFIIPEAGTYGTSDIIYYLTEKGWKKASNYGSYKEIEWTEAEAISLQKVKIVDHIAYLQKSTEENKKKIEEMQKALEN